ncbi:MAG TPA: 50S ribosomal protein L10 [Vicinamibacteria bacterium]|nr:50S ribosomal protein L10 [Vicinamibacteria bacterium]
MNRTEKQQLIDELHKEFQASPHAVLVDFKGLDVPSVTEFRRKVKAAGSRYRVVKNSLALRAAKGTALEKLSDRFLGTTGIAYTGDDPVALAKALVDFAKDHPALEMKVGVVSGSQVLDVAAVKSLSTMPGLPELRARLLGLLQAPASRLVRLLATPATQLAQVMKAHQEKEEGR